MSAKPKSDAKFEGYKACDVSKSFKADFPPSDSDGFCQSFDLKQAREIRAFMDRYGFVVINGVFSAEEVAATVDEVRSEIELKCPSVNRNDSSTWESWPVRSAVQFFRSRFR